MDLAVMQRRSGTVQLYKCGAAPSYLKHGGTVRRFRSDAPPTGLSDSPLPPDRVSVPLQGGDFLVLVSDGIADQSCDEWLLEPAGGLHRDGRPGAGGADIGGIPVPQGPGGRLRRDGACTCPLQGRTEARQCEAALRGKASRSAGDRKGRPLRRVTRGAVR
ncbi:MAG: SpoIIE family protein phosphatase [Oscillospiraceae bacterium]